MPSSNYFAALCAFGTAAIKVMICGLALFMASSRSIFEPYRFPTMKSLLLAVDTEIVMHDCHRAVRSHRDMQCFVYQKVISRTLADHPEVVHET